eukprot:4317268-Amphidinium_carterae.1
MSRTPNTVARPTYSLWGLCLASPSTSCDVHVATRMAAVLALGAAQLRATCTQCTSHANLMDSGKRNAHCILRVSWAALYECDHQLVAAHYHTSTSTRTWSLA